MQLNTSDLGTTTWLLNDCILFECKVTGWIWPGLHLESDGETMAFPNLRASRVSVSIP